MSFELPSPFVLGAGGLRWPKVTLSTSFDLPSPPVLVAGGLGGPFVMYFVTPARNALTLGATNPTAGAIDIYRQVFSKGFARGWTGGISPSIAACPQFLSLGPAYHGFHSMFGMPGGIVCTSVLESMLVYGAESRNAQLAANQKNPGKITKLQPAWKPWGPGISCHITRNIIAVAGMRMFSQPCTYLIEKTTAKSNTLTKFGGDFGGNVIASCCTAPVHQLFGFMATSPELQGLSGAAARKRMLQFLKEQYTVTVNGKTRISSVVPRDLFMRSMQCATMLTMYLTIERTLVAYWQQ